MSCLGSKGFRVGVGFRLGGLKQLMTDVGWLEGVGSPETPGLGFGRIFRKVSL